MSENPVAALRRRAALSFDERDGFCRRLASDIEEAGGVKLVALLMGRAASTVYGWFGSRDSDAVFLPLAGLVKLVGGGGETVRALSRLAGGAFVPHVEGALPEGRGLDAREMQLRWAQGVLAGSAALVEEFLAAGADGRFSRRERRALAARVQDLEEAVGVLRLLAAGKLACGEDGE